MQKNIIKETLEVVNSLMDIIEHNLPEIYYKSDEIARADDLLVILENEPDLQAFNNELNK